MLDSFFLSHFGSLYIFIVNLFVAYSLTLYKACQSLFFAFLFFIIVYKATNFSVR